MPDKHYCRRVLDLCVNCPHMGCSWTGEIRQYNAHVTECPKREWNCQYCELKCTFDKGEGMHWCECNMFPEACPNNCEVRFVARKNIEQHKTICSLEPVTCEMSMYGCQAVVPRTDLAMHMKENEGQHLLSLAILNHKQIQMKNENLTRIQQNLQQLQQSVGRMQIEITALKKKVTHIEDHAASGVCQSCTIHTFSNYSQLKLSERDHESKPFFNDGYLFNFRIRFYRPPYDMIVVFLGLLGSDGDDEQKWPVTVNCQVEQMNQIGERGHRKCSSILTWMKAERGVWRSIDSYEMKYSVLEKNKQNVQYLVKDTIMYRLHLQTLTS